MREKYHWKIFTFGIKEAFAGMEVKSHFLWLFTSFFPIFSIPSVKQNKKRQSPKGSKLFFINKVSIFTSLKTQLLSNPPHPSMVFFYFCVFAKSVTIPLRSRSCWGSWDALQPSCFSTAGIRYRWLCWSLLHHGAPWEVTVARGAGTAPSCAEHTLLSHKPRHHAWPPWLFLSTLMAPVWPNLTQLAQCNPSPVFTNSKRFLLEDSGKQRNMYVTWGQAEVAPVPESSGAARCFVLADSLPKILMQQIL